MTTPPEEKELLFMLHAGDQQAFEKIYRTYAPRLFGKLLKLVKSEAYAQEILQDVFLKVWEYKQSIDPQKSFRSFLFKMAENKAYDFFRKAARDKSKEAELIALSCETDINIADYTVDDENFKMLEKAIESLPPQRQQIFRLCKLEGKSYKEVGELLNISVSTISDHIVKGTKTIREYFEKHHRGFSLLFLLFLSFQ
jgi:RNA polymerase sigma-70 factor (family 1)